MILALIIALWLIVLWSVLAAARIGSGGEVKPFEDRPAWFDPGRARERRDFWPRPALTMLTPDGRRALRPVRFRFNLLAPGQGAIGFNARTGRAWWQDAPFFEFPWEREERIAERTREQIAEAGAEFEAADEHTRAALLAAAQEAKELLTWRPLTEKEQRQQFFTLDPVKDFEVGLVPVAAAVGIPVSTAAKWRRDWTRLGAPRYRGIKGELARFAKGQRVLGCDLAGCDLGKFEEIRGKLADAGLAPWQA